MKTGLRVPYFDKKDTVEDCLTLTMIEPLRRVLNAGPGVTGTFTWTQRHEDERTGERKDELVSRLAWATEATDTGLAVRLTYTQGSGEAKQTADYRVPVVSIATNLGGRKWYFLCPSCRKRVGKLYLPPGGLYFGCRECHSLTYTSCQESNKTETKALDRFYGQMAERNIALLKSWGRGQEWTVDTMKAMIWEADRKERKKEKRGRL